MSVAVDEKRRFVRRVMALKRDAGRFREGGAKTGCQPMTPL